MIEIFADHITPRLIYVLDFCFKEKNQNYTLITSTTKWANLSSQDINYSRLNLPCKLKIEPQGILVESAIYPSKKVELNNGKLEIDGVNDSLGLIFYFLTRYESYFSDKTDMHGRLAALHNTLVKLKLHKKVVVDQLVKKMWEVLELDYAPIKSKFKIIPSFDIDVAWAYKNRKMVRTLGAFKGGNTIDRIRVLSGAKKDPYDTYDLIKEIAKNNKNTLCFILLGDWGKYDKNMHWENEAYRSLIRDLGNDCKLGIHPSYASYLNTNKIKEEKKRLELITEKEIKKSRQHFLRLKIPDSFEVLETCDLEEDYSLGFADNIGFRAGTSFPYSIFDLKSNTKNNLLIHPFAYMDSALKDYLKLSPKQAEIEINNLMDEVKSVGGDFIFIWHNSSIHNSGEWKGWQKVLFNTVNK